MLLNIGIIIVSPLNPLFPSFLHHHCLQILYTTNVLMQRECFFISCPNKLSCIGFVDSYSDFGVNDPFIFNTAEC